MARVDPQLYMRIPAELKAALDQAAAAAGRSLTAEVAYRLQASFGRPSAAPAAAARQCLRGCGPMELQPGNWALMDADGAAAGRCFSAKVHRCAACRAIELVDTEPDSTHHQDGTEGS